MSKIRSCDSKIANDVNNMIHYIILAGAILLAILALALVIRVHRASVEAKKMDSLTTQVAEALASQVAGYKVRVNGR